MKIEGSHALAGRKRNKRKNRAGSRRPIAPRPIESGSRHSRGKRERKRERGARFERIKAKVY